MYNDEYYMTIALSLAKESAGEGEVPVGAVAVWDDGEIIGTGRNRRELGKNALYHAEIEAINNACNYKKGWRLHKCTLYVTLEPCPMCAGAIINSRIKRVVYGTKDQKAGAFGSVYNINDLPLNHKSELTAGLMECECQSVLSDFFKELRERKKKEKNN